MTPRELDLMLMITADEIAQTTLQEQLKTCEEFNKKLNLPLNVQDDLLVRVAINMYYRVVLGTAAGLPEHKVDEYFDILKTIEDRIASKVDQGISIMAAELKASREANTEAKGETQKPETKRDFLDLTRQARVDTDNLINNAMETVRQERDTDES